VNSLFVLLGIESWKPVLTALLLPPVPGLVLMLVGARLMLPRRGLGWLLILLGAVLIWLSACTGAARVLAQLALPNPAALSTERIAELKAQAALKRPLAIVVLGGGMEPLAPEYRLSNLNKASLERLHYGLWLNRETGIPVAFSGGAGWAQADATPEAQTAARIAAQDFGRPLKWVEDQSRDTRENAGRSIALLREAGVKHLLLVTHGWHMARALRAFEQAAGNDMRVEAAPMGLAKASNGAALAWLPTPAGYERVHQVLHEVLGRLMGA
jgi:uncharacterized SAM-binding protein YcdF (DUF218 family)